jgi:FKBP-type peptidyl-prolyl cis-trans isomerase 2
MRRAAIVVLVVALFGSLTGCTSTSTSANCTPTPAGPVSDGIKVTGAYGSKPTVKIGAPISVKTTERTVLIPGKGAPAATGDEVTVDFTLFNAKSGAEVTSTDYTSGSEQSFVVDTKLYLVGLIKTIHCSAAGSRVVGVIPPKDSWGDVGSDNLGVAADESIVFVADIVTVLPGRSTGKDQPAKAGFPKVTLAKDGTPSVVIPKADPPTELKVAVLKLGNGKVIATGDTVRLQYVGLNWTTGEVWVQTWGHSNPLVGTTDGFIDGFGAALVGQTVNSQIIVIIPPDRGYGAAGGPEGSGIGPTDTVVYVVDILPTK